MQTDSANLPEGVSRRQLSLNLQYLEINVDKLQRET